MIQHPPYHQMDNTISLSHHNISHHRYMVLSPSNYSASFEDHKLLLVSLQRPKSTESETLHLFTEVGLKLILVLCSACVIAGFVAFCMKWLPRKAARYRRLSSIPGLRERYKPRAQCLLNEETDQQGSDADTERCTVPILNEVTRIWQHVYSPFYTMTVAKEIFLNERVLIDAHFMLKGQIKKNETKVWQNGHDGLTVFKYSHNTRL